MNNSLLIPSKEELFKNDVRLLMGFFRVLMEALNNEPEINIIIDDSREPEEKRLINVISRISQELNGY